jgi:hypothetical protein
VLSWSLFWTRQSLEHQVCSTPYLLLRKIRCVVLPARLMAECWWAVIPSSDSSWTKYDSDRCAALPACYCARSGVRHSLPDLWQSAGEQSSLPMIPVEPNTIVTGVRHSLPNLWQSFGVWTSLSVSLNTTNTLATGVWRSQPVAVQGQVRRYPCVFLWKSAWGSALVIHVVHLFAINKSNIGAL